MITKMESGFRGKIMLKTKNPDRDRIQLIGSRRPPPAAKPGNGVGYRPLPHYACGTHGGYPPVRILRALTY
jgi:hypothetical protein